jgi:hypothetical protein
MNFFLLCLFISLAIAQVTLEEVSSRINKSLPENYDHMTRLRTTTVENNHLVFHFLVKAEKSESQWAMPKVKEQVLKTICSDSREGSVLKRQKVNIVYRYENVKGQSLGEFMVTPEHCRR